MRRSAYVLAVLSTIVLVVQVLNFIGTTELLFFDILGYLLLGVSLYLLDLPARLFRRKPSRVLAFSRLARFGPPMFCLCGAWVANALMETFSVLVVTSSLRQLNYEALVRFFLLLFGFSFLAFFAMIDFSNRLGFYVQRHKQSYELVIRGFFITSVYLGFGGDIFIGVGILLTAFLSDKPLDHIERSFWLVWKKGRRNPEIRLLFSSLGVFSLVLVFNFRFIDLHSPYQMVFMILVIIPLACSYFALKTEKQERTFVLATIASYFLWILFMAHKPEAVPLEATFITSFSTEFTVHTAPFIVLYAWPIFLIAASLAFLVESFLSSIDYKWSSLDQDIFRDFLSNLFLLAMIGLIFEIVFLPKNVEELAFAMRSSLNNGILPVTTYKKAALFSTVIAFLGVFAFSLHDISVIRTLLSRRRKRKIKITYFLLEILCLAIFSVSLVTADLELMSKNQSSLREIKELTFPEEGFQVVYKVADPHLWIYLNVSQVGNDLFGVSVDENSYKELTTGTLNVTLQKVSHVHKVYITLINDTGTERGGTLSLEIYTDCLSSLAGGPLYYVHIPGYVLLVPQVYSILIRKKRES